MATVSDAVNLGIAWTINNDEQQENFFQHCRDRPYPYSAKCGKIATPGTLKQLAYAHSLCNSLAVGKGVSKDKAKRDAKAQYGVVQVSMSCVTGDKSATLISFADYDTEQLTGFCTAMEAFLSHEEIPFHASKI